MTKQNKPTTVGRRDFLRVLATGAGAAAASVAPVTQAAADAESDQDRKKARYKETDHVKTFYKVNRY